MTITQLAGSLPRNPRFREWCAEDCAFDSVCEELAAHYIRVTCRVASRRDLATNPEAAERFHNLIRKPYLAWCEQLEQTA